MDGDQVAILFIGFLFLVGGVGLLFVNVNGSKSVVSSFG
jgi:hypothetical protein